MQQHENVHSRKQFQIDRVAFFSDAVIAIGITLMVLEIKIPPLGEDTKLIDIYHKYIGSFIAHAAALIICFISIGNLWIKHHELYEHITNYNTRLVKRNLYFLLSVILLPATISFMMEENNPEGFKEFTFFINIAICNFLYFFMLKEIMHEKNNFYAKHAHEKIKRSLYGTVWVTCVFFVAATLALLGVKQFYYIFLIGPLFGFIRKRIVKAKARADAGIAIEQGPQATQQV